MEVKKKCINCKKEFITDKSHPYQEYCSGDCWKKVNLKDSRKKYYQENKEKIRSYHQDYYSRPDVILRKKEYDKQYRLKNLQKIKERVDLWLLNNRNMKNKKDKEYYSKNKDKYSLYNQRSHKKRFKEDINYRLIYTLRRRLQTALKKYLKTGKIMSSKKYGIDYPAIIEHLKPFPVNISAYHIDHIRPLCSFDLNNPEEVNRAFSPENHQWLLAEENLSKGGRWNGNIS